MGADKNRRHARAFELGEVYRIRYKDPCMVWEQGLTDGPPEMDITLTGDCMYLDDDLVGLAAESLPQGYRAVSYVPLSLIRSAARLQEES